MRGAHPRSRRPRLTDSPTVKILYVGNYQPGLPEGVAAWSTETHIAWSIEDAGHRAIRCQERDSVWREVPALAAAEGADLVLWTRTFGLDRDLDAQVAGIAKLRDAGITSAAIHLDKWWDLPRADQLTTEPWFHVDHVFTADGGNDAGWARLGINHHWSPPGVVRSECHRGSWRAQVSSDIAFVGSHTFEYDQGQQRWLGYHPEWAHRRQLVRWLRHQYGDRVRFWPSGGRQVRGQMLADVYASTRVLIGDSCMVSPGGRYWSDRIPETLGRGGFLLHPNTAGLGEQYTLGEHLVTWDVGDWDKLHQLIEHHLNPRHDDERRQIASAGQAHVVAEHTYTRRVEQMLATIAAAEVTV